MRSVAVGLALLVVAGCGSGAAESSAPAPTSTAATPVAAAPGVAFPDNVPTDSDGECSLPRTDPARPKAGPLGKITDGVEVWQVQVDDGGRDEVVVRFMVTSPPYVRATSGERWVVVTFDGVRRFSKDAVIATSPHTRRLPATVCDDSGAAFALAFDREVAQLKLENDREPTLHVFLKP